MLVFLLFFSPKERLKTIIIKHATLDKVLDCEYCCFCSLTALDFEVKPLKMGIGVGVRSHEKFVLQKSTTYD